MSATNSDATAVVGRRIGAWVIDLIIYLVIAFVVASALGFGTKTTTFSTKEQAATYCDTWRTDHSGGFCFNLGDQNQGTAYTSDHPAGGAAILLGHLVAYALLQGVLGGSLGKLAVGLRVVDAEGKQAGIGKSFLRTILWVADAITFALPIVGGILLLSTKGHRRLGDMAAGTYVVDKNNVGRPPLGGYGTPGYGAGGGYGQASGYGTGGAPGWAPPPSGPGAWGAPANQGTWGSPSAPPATSSSASGDEPTWDQARNAYIQYDRDRSEWMQWDDTTKAWGPISQ